MTNEEEALLARIGQLAGQINRHKAQNSATPTGPVRQPNYKQHNTTYRQAAAPYHPRSYRGGRPPTAHRHRTLHLNSSANSSPSGGSPAGSTPDPSGPVSGSGWVSKTDRHRQLINASVYEKDSQNRAKAIEETRQRNLAARRKREKTRFRQYLGQQAGASATNATTAAVGHHEITIDGITFKVMDGGKKLARMTGDTNSAPATPKTAVVAGIKFHRTKTGNLVVNRVVQTQRRSGVIKKVGERCKTFSTTGNPSFLSTERPNVFTRIALDRPGSCSKGPMCRYVHDPAKVAICREYLKDGKCPFGDGCDLSHDATPERVPNCLHYAKGHCAKPDCVYTHSKAPAGAPVCRDFGYYGFCDRGAECLERHVFECPDFSNTGQCKIKGCKLLHRERASVLRNMVRADDEDLSDDDEDDDAADSDDVDSDEVAEFIEADSDDSDFENPKDFLAL